jgi:DNA-nicking Smr family endonuclease
MTKKPARTDRSKKRPRGAEVDVRPPEPPPNRPFAALAKKAAAERKAASEARPEKAAAAKPAKSVREGGATKKSDAPKSAATKKAEDVASFDAYMRGVERLPAKSKRIPKTASAIDEVPKAEAVDLDAPARLRLRALVDGALRFEVTDDGDVVEGRRLDVDPRELRRLRRQAYGVDGTLDLHGLNAEVARTTVERFLSRRRNEGDRAVLVVHGKGRHSAGSAVLRGEIGAWLSQGASARDVLAFASVPEPDGPSGAVLILLAKR